MFKKWFVCEARTGEHLLNKVPYGVFSVWCFFVHLGDNPVRVYIRNSTGGDTQKVYSRLHSSARSKQSNVEVHDGAWSADANAHKLKSTAIQMGTDDTKGYSGGFDVVLYEVSTDIVTKHAHNLLQV